MPYASAPFVFCLKIRSITYNYYVYLWNKKGSITGQTSNSNDGVAKDPQTYDKIYADADRDHWFTAIEAKEYGLVDDVIYKKK